MAALASAIPLFCVKGVRCTAFHQNNQGMNFVSLEECDDEYLPLVDWSGGVEWRKVPGRSW